MISPSPLAQAFWKNPIVPECPVIDTHGHMGPFYGIYMPRASTEDMLRSMDHAGVRMLVFSHHNALFNPRDGNDDTMRAVRAHPDRLRGYMVINGNYMDLVERDMARFDSLRDAFVGLKFLSAYHNVALDDPRYDRVWTFAQNRKLPVLCHTWGGSNTCGARNIRAVVEKHPEVRLLMGHSLHGHWEEAAKLATEFPHVYCELTAVFENYDVLNFFESRGCARRMLFGTDLPWFSPLHGIGCVLSADVSDDTRHNILHRNAEDLLRPFLGSKLL